MSAYGMHPKFTDEQSYVAWRTTWRSLYREISGEIRKERRVLLGKLRADPLAEDTRKLQSNLAKRRVMASKMMTLRRDAAERWRRILAMDAQIAEQMVGFPQTLDCASVDFYFNKASLEFPKLPAWIVKTKGKTFYMHHVEFDCVGTTRETPDHPATKGSMRFRHCILELRPDGSASIQRKSQVGLAIAA